MVEGSVSFTDPSEILHQYLLDKLLLSKLMMMVNRQEQPKPQRFLRRLPISNGGGNRKQRGAQDITTENISNAAQEADANSQDANETAPPEGEVPEATEQSQEQETIETIQEQASGAAGGAIFAAAGAGGNVDDIASLATELTNTLAMEMASHAEVLGYPLKSQLQLLSQEQLRALLQQRLSGMDAMQSIG